MRLKKEETASLLWWNDNSDQLSQVLHGGNTNGKKNCTVVYKKKLGKTSQQTTCFEQNIYTSQKKEELLVHSCPLLCW